MSRALRAVLPREVASAWLAQPVDDAELFDEEVCSISGAVAKRQREFTSGRACARMALTRLGFPPVPIPVGRGGAPTWPDGIVGSITHCHGFIASAVASKDAFAALGIDAEPNEPLPPGTLSTIMHASEEQRIAQALEDGRVINWDRFLFSAKESVFKAWFTLTGCALEPEGIVIRAAAPDRFVANVIDGAAGSGLDTQLWGRLAIHQRVLITAVVVRHGGRQPVRPVSVASPG